GIIKFTGLTEFMLGSCVSETRIRQRVEPPCTGGTFHTNWLAEAATEPIIVQVEPLLEENSISTLVTLVCVQVMVWLVLPSQVTLVTGLVSVIVDEIFSRMA